VGHVLFNGETYVVRELGWLRVPHVARIWCRRLQTRLDLEYLGRLPSDLYCWRLDTEPGGIRASSLPAPSCIRCLLRIGRLNSFGCSAFARVSMYLGPRMEDAGLSIHGAVAVFEALRLSVRG